MTLDVVRKIKPKGLHSMGAVLLFRIKELRVIRTGLINPAS